MKLLGDRNWYLPKWLQWLPKVDVEGHEAAVVEVPQLFRRRANRGPRSPTFARRPEKGAAARAAPLSVVLANRP